MSLFLALGTDSLNLAAVFGSLPRKRRDKEWKRGEEVLPSVLLKEGSSLRSPLE